MLINKHRRLLTCNRFPCIHIVVELLNIFMPTHIEQQQHVHMHAYQPIKVVVLYSGHIHVETIKLLDKRAQLCVRTHTTVHVHSDGAQVQRYHIFTMQRVVSCQLPFGSQQCNITTLDNSHFIYSFNRWMLFLRTTWLLKFLLKKR